MRMMICERFFLLPLEKLIFLAMNQETFKSSRILIAKFTIFLLVILLSIKLNAQKHTSSFVLGIEQPEKYLPLLQGKNVGVVTNQTGVILQNKKYNASKDPNKCMMAIKIDTTSVVDFLLENSISVKKIFAPEHGFRGTADAGETVKDGKDTKTNLPIVSLYGKNKKPSKEQFEDLDVILFDIQDVGVRFYTYISTLHYIMEAAAQYGNKKVIVLDRPNPNAHYVDGFVLEKSQTSFVGMHQVPVVYGMTIGEYAKMINGEKWLENEIQANLEVIPLQDYTHKTTYSLPIKPSPNLPNDKSINLYPSTCLFEGANVSEGRGTSMQFQVYGSPFIKKSKFSFTPKPNAGAKEPRFKGKICYGKDLRNEPKLSEFKLSYLIDAFKTYKSKEPFWIKNSGDFWIDKLAGTDKLRLMINQKKTENEIRATWKKDVEEFKKIRKKYLLYAD
jgi:uncharacterized protein YbbC (DUF1343 family)